MRFTKQQSNLDGRKVGEVEMSEELKLIESILAHAEDEKTNRSWATDDVGWKNVDAIWQKAEQLKKLLKMPKITKF